MFHTTIPPVSSGPSNPVTTADQMIRSLKTSEPIVVFVHASWCGHCNEMYPIWNNICKSRGDEKHLLSIESAVVNQFESRGSVPVGWNVEGFPTIWLISDGRVIDTFNNRQAMLSNWVSEKLGAQTNPIVVSSDMVNISAPRMEPNSNYVHRKTYRMKKKRKKKTKGVRRITRRRKGKSKRRGHRVTRRRKGKSKRRKRKTIRSNGK